MNYLNREARESDLICIQEIIKSASVEGIGIEGTQEELFAWQKTNCAISLLKSRLEDSKTLLLVSETSQTNEDIKSLVGTAYAVIKEGNKGYLGGLYCIVKGKGVGSSLIKDLSLWLEVQGAKSIEMVVAGRNKAMLSLVDKIGFEIVGSEVGEFLKNGTWLILKKKL